MLAAKLLDIIVCPQCKGALALVENGRGLLCNQCQLKYLVREDIPVMIPDEAIDMQTGKQRRASPALAKKKQVAAAPLGSKVTFKVSSGADKGLNFHLAKGTCSALGRATGDPNKTSVLSVDWALTLDAETKGLILQYIQQQFRTPTEPVVSSESNQLGNFKRATDIVLKDAALSRLHAMLFFDPVGVGILDLVSKNGTFINGEEVESRLLKKGDVIEVGESKIVFEG